MLTGAAHRATMHHIALILSSAASALLLTRPLPPLPLAGVPPPLTATMPPPSSPMFWEAPRAPRRAVTRMMSDEDEVEPDIDVEAGALAMPINRYVESIQNISAPELIKGFAETAPDDVQQAVRSTVVSLLGNLPPHLYDVNVMSTGQNVASLMYSMQMTGYMVRTRSAKPMLTTQTLTSARRATCMRV